MRVALTQYQSTLLLLSLFATGLVFTIGNAIFLQSGFVLPLYYDAVIPTAFVAALLCWRILLVHLLLARGEEVQALISECVRYPKQGRLSSPYLTAHFTYDFEGKTHSANRCYYIDYMTDSIRDGERVTLMVDRNKPERFVFRNP